MAQETNFAVRTGRLIAGFPARIAAAAHRHWRVASGVLLAAVAIGAVLLIASRASRPAAAAVAYPHEVAQVSFAVAGDVIPHEPVRAAAAAAGEGAAGWGALFTDVRDVFQHADFGFVNLETPVAPAHSHGSKPFHVRRAHCAD